MREMGPGYLQMHVARLTFSQFGLPAGHVLGDGV